MKKTWMIVGSLTLLCIASWLLVIVILFDPFSKNELTTMQGEDSSSLFDVYGEHLSINHRADLLGIEEFERELAAENLSSSITEISLESETADDKVLKVGREEEEEETVESDVNYDGRDKEDVTEEITTMKGIRPGDFSHIAPDGIISIETLFEELSLEVE
jgi:amino acid permease